MFSENSEPSLLCTTNSRQVHIVILYKVLLGTKMGTVDSEIDSTQDLGSRENDCGRHNASGYQDWPGPKR